MSHDRTAEFDGYVNEYRHHHKAGNTDALPAIKAEIDRVSGDIEAEADERTRAAEVHEEAGQDVLAARARVRARELRGHLETAVANLPQDVTVPPRKGSKGTGSHAAD